MLTSYTYGQESFKEIKSLSKKLDYKEGATINITGERTFIYISTWDENYVEAEVEVISRYKDQKQAKADLELINVIFEKYGEDIFFSNAIQVTDVNNKPKSNLKTILNLKVPEYATLELKNSFGEIEVLGQMVSVSVVSNFCRNSFMDYSGDLSLKSKYDDVSIVNSEGQIKIEGNRSDMILTKVGGKVDLGLEYGALDMTYGSGNFIYDVKAKYTPITVYLSPGLEIYHEYECKNCTSITDNCNERISKSNSKKKDIVIMGDVGNTSRSKIQSESENVTIISITQQANNK
jgi:hypothetical protein